MPTSQPSTQILHHKSLRNHYCLDTPLPPTTPPTTPCASLNYAETTSTQACGLQIAIL